MKTFRRKVQKGQKLGRTLGFPTLNLSVGSLLKSLKQGVYVCDVTLREKSYRGMMHLGPKLGKKKPVLEIHVIGFSQEVYNEWVEFSPVKFVRPPLKFDSLEGLKKQIQDDLTHA